MESRVGIAQEETIKYLPQERRRGWVRRRVLAVLQDFHHHGHNIAAETMEKLKTNLVDEQGVAAHDVIQGFPILVILSQLLLGDFELERLGSSLVGRVVEKHWLENLPHGSNTRYIHLCGPTADSVTAYASSLVRVPPSSDMLLTSVALFSSISATPSADLPLGLLHLSASAQTEE
jgi:hypothetical protein